MSENTLKALHRIFNSDDGRELITFLTDLKNRNYEYWKQEGGDVLRGKAICYDEIIFKLESSKEKLATQQITKSGEWL